MQSKPPEFNNPKELLGQRSLYDLSKKLEEIFNVSQWWIEFHGKFPKDTPYALSLQIMHLSKKLTIDKVSFRNRFYNGVLTESVYNVPKKAKKGYEQTLESVKNEIKIIAAALTGYKKDFLELGDEDCDIHAQEAFIIYLEEIENAIVSSYINLPEYKEQKETNQHAHLKEKALLGFVDIEILRTLPIEERILEDYIPNLLPPINPIPLAQVVTSFSSHSAINETNVDLETYPHSHGMPLTSTDCLVLGDLHGNALKLINFLLRENIMMGIGKEDYDELVTLYKLSSKDMYSLDDNLQSCKALMRKKIFRFNEIIAQLTPVNSNAIPSIILIGDVLADRGNNDYYTLRILAQLNSKRVFPKILLSNHDREFLHIYERGFNDFKSSLAWKESYECGLYNYQCNSIEELGRLIQLGLISTEEVVFLVEQVYLPLLSGIELNINWEQKELTIFTHAPVSLKIISALAQQLNIPMEEKTSYLSPIQIIEMVDLINTKLKELLQEKALFKCSSERTPLYELMWNRYCEHQPILSNEWSLVFVHGHDGKGKTTKKISDNISTYDLDNELGKENKNAGAYNIFYCGDNIRYSNERTIAQATIAAQNAISSHQNSFFSSAATDSETPQRSQFHSRRKNL